MPLTPAACRSCTALPSCLVLSRGLSIRSFLFIQCKSAYHFVPINSYCFIKILGIFATQMVESDVKQTKATSESSMGTGFNPIPIVKNKLVLYLWGLSIAIGAFVMGYFFVIVTVLSSSLTEHANKISEDGQQKNMAFLLSICTTAMPLGGLIGSLLYTRIINAIQSENRLMIYTDICMILALLTQMTSLNIYSYSVIRLIEGFITGLYGIVIPQYLISISPTKISGLMGSFNQIMITIGIATAYGMGYVINPEDLSNQLNWRLCVFLPIPFCIIRILTCKYFPYDSIERHIQNRDWNILYQYIDTFYLRDSMSLESLIRSKNIDVKKIEGGVPKDRNTLQFGTSKKAEQNGSQNSQKAQEMEQERQVSAQNSQQNHSRGLRLRQMLAVAISIMAQFSGINAILFYSNQLFLDISHGDADYAVKKSLHLGIFQIVVTLISGAVMDRFGRRTLMICGEAMIILALVSGYYMVDFDSQSNWDPQYVTYAIFVHMAGFSLSLGPITVVYISEIVTDISPYMTFIWIQTILISLVSNIMIQKFGTGKVFLFFAIISISGLVYVCKYMLETKGKTRQEVVNNFDNFDGPQIDNCLNSINNMIQDKEKKNYRKVNEAEH